MAYKDLGGFPNLRGLLSLSRATDPVAPTDTRLSILHSQFSIFNFLLTSPTPPQADTEEGVGGGLRGRWLLLPEGLGTSENTIFQANEYIAVMPERFYRASIKFKLLQTGFPLKIAAGMTTYKTVN